MDKEKIETILWKLKEMEWKFHRVNDGPDEDRCPAGCVIQNHWNKISTLEHDNNCEFKEVLDFLQKELDK